MPDPIIVWALVVVALIALRTIFIGITMIYQIRTYHLLNESSPYPTAPLVPDEQAV